jgi:hypothetical protein
MNNLLIAGSRDISKGDALRAIEDAYWELPGLAPDQLVTGDARGVDTWGQQWWLRYLGGPETIIHMPADWDTLGKRAGYLRNVAMAEITHQAIIVWDGKSKGTQHMMQLLNERGIEYVMKVVEVE